MQRRWQQSDESAYHELCHVVSMYHFGYNTRWTGLTGTTIKQLIEGNGSYGAVAISISKEKTSQSDVCSLQRQKHFRNLTQLVQVTTQVHLVHTSTVGIWQT